MFSQHHQGNQIKRTLNCGLLVLLVLFCVLCSACGQTGPLKLPEDDKKEEADK